MTKQRLLVLASTYPRWKGDHEPGFVHALAKQLVDRFDVVAVVPHAPGSLRREVLDGVTVVRYRYAPAALETLVSDGGIASNLSRHRWKWLLLPSFVVMQWWEARRWLTHDTIVHAHWLIPQGMVARALRRPYVLTSHGADVFSLRGRLPSVAKRFALRRASAATVVSHAMVEPLTDLGSPCAPSVHPMGVDLSVAFTPDENIVRESNHLLFVGRLVGKKGVDVLLRAMSEVLTSHPGARLSIVGHGPLAASLERLAGQLGLGDRVTFTGPLDQAALVPLYRAATVFVAPFRQTASGDQEGLGLVTIEALGCGCPVIASDLPATRDVLSGTAGCVAVAPDDPSALAAAIVSVLDAPGVAAARARSSLPALAQRFDWRAVGAAYAKVFSDLGRRSL
ncbi:Glycosyltransferase involved in cell wall bisynthesis [Luteibacter sp. UNCMF331Sha3.1]|uniref:glycosyltransferase n=1 Tax=Luteibacter sp. UNCMF331Sha3.1 TaxID=1502760 RepID=UPI0008B3CB7F|nr:glycosyltransferase [Luteibacter sp. UNCMF331Sha3.1]SEM92389.1 Glycosyltransferase involved in cell wall bisynthesis [Luteibacter sp. UNCMF331Sha3.1]